MPRSDPRFPTRLDRRIRLIVWAKGARVGGRYQHGPVVLDQIVWAAKGSNASEFELSKTGSYPTARETFIVRAFRTRQNGQDRPEVLPYAAGGAFRVVDPDGRHLQVESVTEVGRSRFLELACVADEPFTPSLAGITYAGGVPAGG